MSQKAAEIFGPHSRQWNRALFSHGGVGVHFVPREPGMHYFRRAGRK